MSKLLSYSVLLAGILSPPAAFYLGQYVYATLTRASADPDQDFVFRLSMVILAMIVPFALTLTLFLVNWKRRSLTRGAKVGLAIAVLSLGLAAVPANGLIGRLRQAQNLAAHDVAAPLFDTVDISGKPHRLQDHSGKVVVINAWATWCAPCRQEMPQLDKLYQSRKDQGLMVFGLSTEDLGLQKKFVEEVLSVSYPLLTMNGNVPSLYSDIQKWPALFLIDRAGKLQPAPGTGEPFTKVEAAVDALLKK